MHPPHVPLQAEAETAQVGGLGDARVRGGLLGDGDDARYALVGGGVELLEEVHDLEVLPPAVDVRLPLAVLARVVQVEHRGDRVDPEPVDVELLQPVERVGDEEVAHLGTAVVEHERAPLRVLAPAGVGVLVQGLAVERGQRPGVLGEVGRDPVHDHADARLVERVDQVPEVVGAAEPAGRGVVPGDLVAPGAAEGVLGDRKQLDVGEPEVGDVGDELVGQLPVRQPLPPGAEVDLVDAHRGVVDVRTRPLRQPRLVPPGVGGPGDHGGGRRGDLGAAGHRVGLLVPATVLAEQLELVAGARAQPRDEELPDAGPAEGPHRVGAPVPGVDVADHPDGPRVGCPHREARALAGAQGALEPSDVGAQHGPQLLVAALADQVQVDLADARQVAVRVVDGVDRLPLVGVVDHLQPVVAALRAGQRGRPDAVVLVVGLGPTVLGEDRDPARERLERPHGGAGAVDVRAEHPVGVVVGAGGDRREDVAGDAGRTRTGLGGCHGPILPMRPPGANPAGARCAAGP